MSDEKLGEEKLKPIYTIPLDDSSSSTSINNNRISSNRNLLPSPYSVIDQQPTTDGSQSVIYLTRSSQNIIINHSNFIPSTSCLYCPKCSIIVKTQISYRPGCRTHTWAGILCFFGCCICAPIPYFSTHCMNEQHFCSVCKAYIDTSY